MCDGEICSQITRFPPVRTSRSGRLQLLGLARVVALFVVTHELAAVLLRDLLDEEGRAAVRALLCHGLVPQGEIAVGIIRAAVEHLAAPRFPFDDVAAVLGAEDAGRLLLHVLAGRIARARRELAESSLLHDEIGPALRALL